MHKGAWSLIKNKNKTTAIFFAIVVVFCITGFLWHRYFWFDMQYDTHISTCCNEFDVDKSLVYAIVKAESNFDENAMSSKGAIGLMQIMPSTATFVAQKIGMQTFDLANPQDNLTLGIAYLSYLGKKFDTQKDVICAYNAGENNVKEWLKNGGDILFVETEIYLKRVERNINIYDALYN